MRREDAGINSPVADGKKFDFQRGEVADDDAQQKLARMTTTHKPGKPPTKDTSSSQGWCSCFSMCFGSNEEESDSNQQTDVQTPTTQPKTQPALPEHLMTQVARPDKQARTHNTQPGSQNKAGSGTTTQDVDRSGLQSPREKGDMGDISINVEMTDNKPPQTQPQAGSRMTPMTSGQNEIERFAFKDPNDTTPDPKGLLQPNRTKFKKTLVLDLDETLVHSSFRPVDNPTFIIPVHIDNHVYNVYVLKRPYTDIFLERAAKCYEIIIFTASLAKYADPLLDELDKKKVINGRLFRNSCVMSVKTYVKDLSVLGRQLKNLIIVDNSPLSYQFQPKNAINCTSWFDDPEDTELLDMLPVLETTLLEEDDVRSVLDADNMTFPELVAKAKRDTNTGDEPMWGFSDGTGC